MTVVQDASSPAIGLKAPLDARYRRLTFRDPHTGAVAVTKLASACSLDTEGDTRWLSTNI